MKRIASSLVIALLCAVVVAQGGQKTPKAQALYLYQTLKRQDWHSLYYLIQVTPANMSKMNVGAAKFAAQMTKGIKDSGGAAQLNKVMNSLTQLSVGQPKITGNKAVVPTSAVLTLDGKAHKMRGAAHLIKVGNMWKWDLTQNANVEAATSERTAQILGKPSN